MNEPARRFAMRRPEVSPAHDRRSALRYDQLLCFHELDAEDPEGVWAALEQLSSHLDDHLFQVDSRQLDAGIPHSLITFEARDERRLWAVVTTTGAVIVGCCDELAQATSAQLDDFDPLWHEVVSIAASRRHRLIGDNIDLWIVVRRSPEDPDKPPETVAYHALAWLDEHGQPHLRPACDDGPELDPSSWSAGSAERLGVWLRSWPCTCLADDDLLAEDGLSPAVLDQLTPMSRRAGSGLKAVVRGHRFVGVSTGDEIVLIAADQETSADQGVRRLAMPDRAGALTILEDPDGARGIAAFDARRLVAFGVDSDGLQKLWEQSRHELALGLAFLGQAQPPGLPWPDLLVLYRDGRLERLRYLGSDAMRRLWRECWQHLGATDLESRLAIARERAERPEIRRRVILVGIVEALISELPLADRKTRRRWLDVVAELFRSTETIPVLEAGTERLLHELEKHELEKRDQSGADGDDFLTDLLLRIYQQQTHIVIRDQIDRRVRVLSTRDREDLPPAMKELRKRSRRNRLDMWDEEAKSTDELFEQAAVGLERWASAYIRSDRVRLDQHLRRQCLAGLTLPGGEKAKAQSSRWLATAVDHRVAIYVWDQKGKLTLEAASAFELDETEGVRAVLRLPDEAGDRLLVSTHAGKLCLLGVEPRRGHLRPAMTRDLCAWESGYARALACCPHPRSGTVIAVIQQHDRRSTLNLLHLDDGRLQPFASEPLDLAWIRHIDLARAEDGYQLLAGAGQTAPLRLYRLDGEGRMRSGRVRSGRVRSADASRSFHILHSGVSALRFSSAEEPAFAVGGEHNGLLWCLDLGAAAAAEALAWTYQVEGAVRAVERVSVDGEVHFLVGSEGGTLVLLRARDGRRVWKDFLDEPIREVVACDPAGRDVAVTMSRGWVATYRALSAAERAQAFSTVEAHLKRLAAKLPSDDPAWRSSARPATVRAFHRLLVEGRAVDPVLEGFDDRETRARIVRWLAEQDEDPADHRTAAILHGSSLRDLKLLLSYLPEGSEAWDPLVVKELQRRGAGRDDSPSSRRAMVAVAATLLQRHSVHGTDPGDLLGYLPAAVFWASPWLRLEALRALCRQAGKGSEGRRLFPRLLFRLLRWPPQLVLDAADIFPYLSQEREDFLALSQMLRELGGSGAMTAASLERLAEALSSADRPPGLLALLTELHALMAGLADEENDSGNSWTLYRRPAIEALEAVAHRAYELSDPPPAAESLVEGLRAFLRRQPLPVETATLEERARQLELARRRLDEPQADDPGGTGQSWAPFVAAVLDRTRRVTRQLIHREYLHVLYQVRPRLTLLQAQRTPTHRLVLRCRAEAEGRRQLSDVTILFRSRGENGLLPPGTQQDKFEAFVYPGMFPIHEFELSGYVRPEQDQVLIEVSLEDKDGYRAEDRWSFPIPVVEAAQTGKRLSFGTFFPRCESLFLEAVFAAGSSVLLVVLDPELGRQTLLEAWHERFPGRWLDLDTALRDYGSGRRYAAQPLDTQLIDDTLERAIAVADAEAGGSKAGTEPFLVGPIDEIVQRLLDAGEESVLRRWSSQLAERDQRQQRPHLVLLISSLHACELRRFLPVPLPEVAAHRVLGAAWGRSRREELEEEVVDHLEKEIRERDTHLSTTTALSTTTVRAWVNRLGGDLRLILDWLRWREERPGPSVNFQAFLDNPRVEDLIFGELRSLTTLDLIHALLGAEAETALPLSRLRSAHRAARIHRSTPRKSRSTPKDLVRPGEPFTDAVISRLRSDRLPPTTVRVQGFGTAGPSEAPRSRLLELASSRPLELRVASFDRLDRLGIGHWAEGIFRTASPYREAINELYSRFSDVAPDLRDTRAYAAVVGEHRTPAEAITASDLADLDAAYLQTLMPGARPTDLKALRRWAQAVRGTSHEEPEHILTAIFAPDSVRRLDALDGRWDEALGKLGLPLFGIGQLPGLHGRYPRTYLLWLDATASVDLNRAHSALDQAAARWQELKQENGDLGSSRRPMRLYLFGPGAESLGDDPDRRIAILRLADGREAAWEGHLAEGLRRKARARLRLTAFSPFQTNGALPPGSQLFVGRERELEFIKSRLRQVSILIVGGRRVGKTSLLNQIYSWAKVQDDLEPVYIDLQGVKSRVDFLKALYSESENDELGEITRTYLPVIEDTEARSGLRNIAQAIKKRRRLPIFLLNEVDGLMENDPDLIEIWRGLNDDGLARFLMVGYSVIATLGTPKSPFFHFTEGNSFAGRAVAPTALSTSAAERLLDLLESSELELPWRSDAEKDIAYAELLKRSYRIPWVLQRYGQLLVEHLETHRHDVLTWDDVHHVLEQESDVVWQYIDAIDYQNLGYRETQAINRPGFQLVLFALARKIYFVGNDPPIRDPRLRERQAIDPEARRRGVKDLSFTVGDARQTVQDAIAELLIGDERQAVEEWLERLDLEQALRLLTLTLTLEPDPLEHGRYGFLLHIVPLELNRLHGRSDPQLEELILDKAAQFMQLIT